MKIKFILLLVILLPFAIVSIFNQPAIDDFWSANTIVTYGRLGSVKYLFENVSARFFSSFLMSIFNTLPSGAIWIFKVWPVVIILMLIGSFVFFYTSVFKHILTRYQVILGALLFVGLHINNIRVLFDGLYWMSSTVCYQLAICLFAVGIGSVIRAINSPSVFYTVIAILCSVLLPGSAESIVPVYVLVLAVILMVSVKQKYPVAATLCSLSAVIISLAVIYFSKGNTVRVKADGLEHDQNISNALFYSCRAVGYYCVFWLTTPVNIAILLILLPSLQKLRLHANYQFPFKPWTALLLIPIFWLICMVIYLPITYFESSIIPPRITTLVFFIATHLAVIFLWVLLQCSPKFNRLVSYLSAFKKYRKYAWVLFFIAGFTSRNFILVMSDLISGDAAVFNKEANQRYKQIKESDSDTCYVNYYSRWPQFIRSSKKENISFVYMNRFFGKTILYKHPRED